MFFSNGDRVRKVLGFCLTKRVKILRQAAKQSSSSGELTASCCLERCCCCGCRRWPTHTLDTGHNLYTEPRLTENTTLGNFGNIKRLQGSNYTTFDYLRINNRYVTDLEEITATFQRHWQPIYTPHPPHARAHTTINTVTDFLTNNHTHTPEQHIRLANLHDHILCDPITVGEVELLLKHVRKKAPGSSGITYHLIHHLPPNTIKAITHLYNAQLASGYFPELFKTATATLIPKPNKDNSNPLNYRPISLLEILGKTFERIINTRLRTYLETRGFTLTKTLRVQTTTLHTKCAQCYYQLSLYHKKQTL